MIHKNEIILAVHSVAANEHDSRKLKLLISKLGYNLEKYMQTKVSKSQPMCLTFIVEASKNEPILLMVDYLYSAILDELR
ncbi:MAG: hypothetical protein ACMUEL_01175 [Flavobacteriales bacterium Tduv]